MIQTVKMNIGGYAFNVESDAQLALEAYLDAIKNSSTENGGELAEDVEERIAEILLEKCSSERIVTLSMVNAVKGIIGGPEMFGSASADNFTSKSETRNFSWRDSRLYRNREDRFIGGVCSGLSLRFDIDVFYFRLVFCLLTLLGCWREPFFYIIPITYFILWICIPSAKTVQERCRMKKEPLSYDEFYRQASAPAPARTPGLLKVSGRLLTFCVGILLLCAGFTFLTGDVVCAAFPHIHFENRLPTTHHLFHFDFYNLPFPVGRSFHILIVVMWGIMGIWCVYNGVMMLFDIKPPKWRPGLVLFIAWLMSIFAIVAVCLVQIGKFGVMSL